jgi:hypothetical protein
VAAGAGGVKVPASTVLASVIVAFGSVNVDKAPHEGLALRDWRRKSIASKSAHKLLARIFMTASLNANNRSSV